MLESLGNVNVSAEGRVTVSRKSLGIDPNEVANQVKAAKEKTILNPVKDSIELVNKKQAALSTLQVKTQALQSSLSQLRGPQVGLSSAGVFAKNQASISSDSFVDGSSILGVVMTDAAKPGTFSMRVNRLATQDTLVTSGNANVTTSTSALGLQGTLKLGVEGGQTITLTVPSTWTLQDLVNNINAQSGTSKVVATSFAAGPNDMRLSLQAQDTGKPLVIDNRLARQTPGVGADPAVLVRSAKTDGLVAGTGFSDPTVALNWSGTLTLATGPGTSVTLNADANWTAADWVDQINQNAATSGVRASLAREGDADYRLVLRSTRAAANITVTNGLSTGGSVDPATVIPTSAQVPATLSSEVVYQGQTLYRDSNKITDLYPGLTLALLRRDTGTNVTVEIEPDRNAVAQAVDSFISAWNDLTAELKVHMALKEDGTGKSDAALLFNDSIVTTVKDAMSSIMSGNVNGLSSSNLRSFGLTLKSDGTIVKDVDNLGNPLTRLVGGQNVPVTVADSINNRFEDFQKLWAFSESSTNTKFLLDGHPARLPADISQTPVTVTLNRDMSGTLNAVFSRPGGPTVNGAVTVLGGGSIVRIATPAGDTSVYAGLSFTYVGASSIANGGSDSAQITMTQGLGNILDLRLQNYLDSDPEVGAFAQKSQSFSEDIQDKQERLTLLSANLERERERLLSSFGSLNDLMAKLAPIDRILKVMAEKAANAA
ncbi:MAG: flagellar filament capping protein FliD [Holosporales bacterium]